MDGMDRISRFVFNKRTYFFFAVFAVFVVQNTAWRVNQIVTDNANVEYSSPLFHVRCHRQLGNCGNRRLEVVDANAFHNGVDGFIQILGEVGWVNADPE